MHATVVRKAARKYSPADSADRLFVRLTIQEATGRQKGCRGERQENNQLERKQPIRKRDRKSGISRQQAGRQSCKARRQRN